MRLDKSVLALIPECLEEHTVTEGAKRNSPFTEGPLPTSIRNMSSTRSKQAWLTTVYKLTKVKPTVKASDKFLGLGFVLSGKQRDACKSCHLWERKEGKN